MSSVTASDPAPLGFGIDQRLQGFDPTATTSNQFHPSEWAGATSLKSFGMELFVTHGSVSVSLQYKEAGARARNCATVSALGRSSAYSPPFEINKYHGFFEPRILKTSKDAIFDVYFGTNEFPSCANPKVAYILSAQWAKCVEVASAFKAYKTLHDQEAHLVLVPYDHDSSALLGANIHVLPPTEGNDPGGFARAIYSLCFGDLCDVGATHLCFWDTTFPIGNELFARTHAVISFQKPGTFLIASDDEDRVGWPWICLRATDAAELGMPYPFLDRDLAGKIYQTWLEDMGLEKCNLSLTASSKKLTLETPKIDAASSLVAELLLAKSNRRGRGLVGAFRTLRSVQRPSLVHDALHQAALLGPEALLQEQLGNRTNFEQSPINQPLSPMQRLLGNRLSTTLRGVMLENEATLIQEYSSAGEQARTPAFWSRLLSEGDVSFIGSDQARQDIANHKNLAIQTRQMSGRLQNLELVRSKEISRLRTLLKDADKAKADQQRASRTILSLIRNRHDGERAVIVGNGPSLKVSDLERIKDLTTFASNKIFLAYGDTDWRPTYYSVEDHLVLLNNQEMISSLRGSIKLFPDSLRNFGYHEPDVIFIPSIPPKSYDDPLSDPEFPGFSDDLSHGVHWGSTIVYTQIQLAMYMGCKEIILIGIDHSYQLPKTKVGKIYRHAGETNHFHPEYRSPGELWHQPNLDVLEVSYAAALRTCQNKGIKVVNASRKTQLNVFPLANFDDLLGFT